MAERQQQLLAAQTGCDILIFAPQIGHWSEEREITVSIAKSTQADHFYRPVVEPMAAIIWILSIPAWAGLGRAGHQLSKFLPAKLEEN